MSTNEEEIRAMERTRQFLFDLLNPQATKRIPKEIRQRASHCLRHFPLVIQKDFSQTENYTIRTKGNSNDRYI
jgi:hypothetical protein